MNEKDEHNAEEQEAPQTPETEAENVIPQASEDKPAKEQKTEVQNKEQGMLEKTEQLQGRYYTACGKLYKNLDYIGEQMYELMLMHYYELYEREYALMTAAEFIDIDKKIEELKTERAKQLEAVKLGHERQLAEIERERQKMLDEDNALRNERELELQTLAEEHKALRITAEREAKAELDLQIKNIELARDKQLAELELRREKQDAEMEILMTTAIREQYVKESRIMPDMYKRHKIGKLEFGRYETNRAMDLAMAAADIEAKKYLAERADKIAEQQDKYNDTYGTEYELPELKPESKRGKKRRLKRLYDKLKKRKEIDAQQAQLDEQETPQAPEIEDENVIPQTGEDKPAEPQNAPTEAQNKPDGSK